MLNQDSSEQFHAAHLRHPDALIIENEIKCSQCHELGVPASHIRLKRSRHSIVEVSPWSGHSYLSRDTSGSGDGRSLDGASLCDPFRLWGTLCGSEDISFTSEYNATAISDHNIVPETATDARDQHGPAVTYIDNEKPP